MPLYQKISTHASGQNLQQFSNDQDAHKSDTTLLGSVMVESCQGDGDTKEYNLSYDRSKSQAIDLLKSDVIQHGGNAFTLNIYQENLQAHCDLSIFCSGQAYDYQ